MVRCAYPIPPLWLRGNNRHGWGPRYVDVSAHDSKTKSRIIDLDVDVGADAVDYKFVSLAVYSLVFFDVVSLSVPLQTKNRCPGSKLRCASWRELSRRLSRRWITSRKERSDFKAQIVRFLVCLTTLD
jgi:hypothetical protein